MGNIMEQWKDIVGYEDLYQVSNFGNIRSKKSGKLKSICLNKTENRPFLSLWKENKIKIFKPHTLVMTAFISPRPDGMECCHNDGNPFNNHISNLRWDTASSNQADRVRHGTSNRGERCGSAKLTELQVIAIRNDNRLQRIIAKEYGVRESQISRIKNGVRWAHI